MRRRRRRSAFAPHHPHRRYVFIGAGVAAFIAAFVYFMHQADVLAPAPHEMRVDVDVAKQ